MYETGEKNKTTTYYIIGSVNNPNDEKLKVNGFDKHFHYYKKGQAPPQITEDKMKDQSESEIAKRKDLIKKNMSIKDTKIGDTCSEILKQIEEEEIITKRLQEEIMLYKEFFYDKRDFFGKIEEKNEKQLEILFGKKDDTHKYINKKNKKHDEKKLALEIDMIQKTLEDTISAKKRKRYQNKKKINNKKQKVITKK
jgi:hypothetical protein